MTMCRICKGEGRLVDRNVTASADRPVPKTCDHCYGTGREPSVCETVASKVASAAGYISNLEADLGMSRAMISRLSTELDRLRVRVAELEASQPSNHNPPVMTLSEEEATKLMNRWNSQSYIRRYCPNCSSEMALMDKDEDTNMWVCSCGYGR